MSFSLVYPGGFAFGERLPSAVINALDADHANAIDGVGGGSYAPSTQIVIGGSGLEVTGPFETAGDTTIGSDSGDDLTVNAAATFIGDVTFNSALVTFTGNVTLGNGSGDAITVGGAATFNQNVTFNGTTTAFNGNIELGNSAGDDLTVDASTTFVGPVTFEGAVSFLELTVAGDVAFENDVTIGTNGSDLLDIYGRIRLARVMEFQNSGSGIGRVPFRVYELPDADATVSVADGNVFKVPNNTTALRTYTIGDTSSQNGDFMLFFSGAGTQGTLAEEVHINSPASGQDEVWADATNSQWNLFIRIGGEWLKMNFSAE